MANNTNYTHKLREAFYHCIDTCQAALDILHETMKTTDAARAMLARQTAVQACQKCIEACKQMNASAAMYLQHATETDSIFHVRDAVEKASICIAACEQMEGACNSVSERCPDIIASAINTLGDCITSCRKAAEHPDL